MKEPKSQDRRWRDWTAGRPLFGAQINGVGLTKYVFGPLGFASPFWGVGAYLLTWYLSDPVGYANQPRDDKPLLLGAAFYYLIGVLGLLGLACALVAFTTFRQWGRWMTTRYRPPEPPSKVSAPAPQLTS